MIVCSCEAVSERTVQAEIASGASCVDDLTSRCGAGAGCGSCWPELERLLERSVQITAHRHITAA